MKRLTTAIMIVGAFLGGYYLGRQKDSPDILAWVRGSYPHLAESAGRFMSSVASRCESAMRKQDGDEPQRPADRNAARARRHDENLWYAPDGTAYAYPGRHEPIAPPRR